MIVEILVAIVLGISSGIFTGLIPGLHINLINTLLLSFIIFIPTTPIPISIFILAMSITHTFIDSIPSIYLGAPDPDQALTTLPGHKLLLEGKGHLAVYYTIIGSIGTLFLSAFLLPVYTITIQKAAPYIKSYIAYILILIIAYMILKDKTPLKALTFFLLAGSLGCITFWLPNIKQPLFPLLSGLFGLSLLIISYTANNAIPKQKTALDTLQTNHKIKAITAASFMGFIAAFLPGFGSSQAAIIATQFLKKLPTEGFLILVGGINTANMLISLATAYAIQKARNGSVVTILQLLQNITIQIYILFVITALLTGCLATLIALFLSKSIAKILPHLPYKTITIIIISAIILTTFLFDNIIGLGILIAATLLGIATHINNIGKNYLMGCLLIPVIIYFL